MSSPPPNSFAIRAAAGQVALKDFEKQEFEDMQTLRDAFHDACCQLGVSYKVYKGDKHRWYLRCTGKQQWGCPFWVRAEEKAQNTFLVAEVIDHTCPAVAHQGWRGFSSQASIARRHQATLVADRSMRPRQLQAQERAQHGLYISYKQAWRAKNVVTDSVEGKEADQFGLLLSLLLRMVEDCASYAPAAYVDIELIRQETTMRTLKAWCHKPLQPQAIVPSGTFLYYAIIPDICKEAFQNMRPLVVLDACHLNTPYNLILHVACGLDANNHWLPLAWGVFWNESNASWSAFLEHFKLHYSDNHMLEGATFISDRQKGLSRALKRLFPNAYIYFCVHHLLQNVETDYGVPQRQAFKKMVYAKTQEAYQEALDNIKATEGWEAFSDWAQALPPDQYSLYVVDAPRYGQFTSNLVESINSHWLDNRELPILHALLAIWHYVMNLFDRRRQEIKRYPSSEEPYGQQWRWSQWAWNVFKQEETAARFYFVNVSERAPAYIAGVYKGTPAETKRVCLRDGKCSCKTFQDLKIPCRHAIAACAKFKLNAEDYIKPQYSRRAWEETFSPKTQLADGNDQGHAQIWPVSLDNLERYTQVLPPPLKRTSGRQQKKRRQRNEPTGHAKKKRLTRCERCKEVGHNSRTCQRPQAPNLSQRRRQDQGEHTTTSQADTLAPTTPAPTTPSTLTIRSVSNSPAAVRNREAAQGVLEEARQALRAQTIAVGAQSIVDDEDSDRQREIEEAQALGDYDEEAEEEERSESSSAAAAAVATVTQAPRRLLEQPPRRIGKGKAI